MIFILNLFYIFKENPQKPKKKKEEANGTTEAKLNGSDAKPKKTKTKKSEDASDEGSPAIQSEWLRTKRLWYVKLFQQKKKKNRW